MIQKDNLTPLNHQYTFLSVPYIQILLGEMYIHKPNFIHNFLIRGDHLPGIDKVTTPDSPTF